MATTVARRALRVYSAISELRQAHEDILDALIPFFEPILEALDGKAFDATTFAAAVRKTLRWRFNADIAERFRLRLARKGYVKRRDPKQDKWFVTYTPPDEAKTNELPIMEALERIIDQFESFPSRVTDLINYQRTRDQLGDILIRFLVSLDAYDHKELMAEMERIQLGSDARSVLAQLKEGGIPLGNDDRYMCAKFVTDISQNHPEYIPHLSRLASIGLLTEVIDDFIKPTAPAVRSNLVIVLDTPVALDFLGCSGKAIKDDLKTLYDALKNIGCSFVVFPITCDEMTNNLRSMLRLPSNKRHGQTHAAICRGEVKEDFVESVARDPSAALKRIDISVKKLTLDDYPNTQVYFNEDRFRDFFSEVTWVDEYAPREHDATCMALLMRLRARQHSSDLLRCGFAFLTRNAEFVEQSRRYCLGSRLINSVQQGPVVHQGDLFTIAWLRTGLDMGDSIPRGHLLATCDRVLQTRKEVVDAVASRLKQIKPDELEQYEVLLADHRCVQALTDQTLNNEKVVTPQNVGKLLDIMRKSLTLEVRDQYEQKLEDAQKRVEELELKVAQLSGERDPAGEVSDTSTKSRTSPGSESKGSLLEQRKRNLLQTSALYERPAAGASSSLD